MKIITVQEVKKRQRLKAWKKKFAYKPNYKFLTALAGIGLIGVCLATPATNWAIVMIVPGFILQVPVNYDKLKETKMGKIYTKVKQGVLKW